MNNTPLTPAEIRMAVLETRAYMLDELVRDETLPLSERERILLDDVAEKLRLVAATIARRRRVEN